MARRVCHFRSAHLFLLIGAAPTRTGSRAAMVATDAKGFIVPGPTAGNARISGTNQPGVFAIRLMVRLNSTKARRRADIGEGAQVVPRSLAMAIGIGRAERIAAGPAAPDV